MEDKYICVKDYQYSDWCIGLSQTIEEWRESAIGWAMSDDMDEAVELLKKMPKEEVIEYICDIWQIDIEEEVEYIAEKLYELAKDMDFADHEETKEQEIKMLMDALKNIRTVLPENWRAISNYLKML